MRSIDTTNPRKIGFYACPACQRPCAAQQSAGGARAFCRKRGPGREKAAMARPFENKRGLSL